MATNKTKSLKELMEAQAFTWAGATDDTNTKIFIWANFADMYTFILEEIDDETEGHKLKVYHLDSLTKNVKALKSQILECINIVFPGFKGLTTELVSVKKFKSYKVAYDYNQAYYSDNYKFLPEELVKRALEDSGLDVSSYTYTHVSVDRSHSFALHPVDEGYDKYPEEITSIMMDVTKYKTYDLNELDEKSLKRFYSNNKKICMLFVGEAGSGKSTTPLIYCAKHEIPVAQEQITRCTDKDQILGCFVPRTDGEAGYMLKASKARLFAEFGGTIIFNEVNNTDQLEAFNSILDDNRELLLDDGSTIKVHPNTRFIFTMNPGYKGTFELNESLVDRCIVRYTPFPTKEELKSRLEKVSGFHDSKVLDSIIESTMALKEDYKSRNYGTVISPRGIETFLSNVLLYPEYQNKADILDMFCEQFVFRTTVNCDVQDDETLNDLTKISKQYCDELVSILDSGKNTEYKAEPLHLDIPTVDLDMELDDLEDLGSVSDIEEE